MYEGLPVYLNHPTSKDMTMANGKAQFTRDVREKFGVIRNARWHNELGPIGDLHYNGGHSLRESFEWAADNEPSFYALSHNAEGRSRQMANGRRLVESISQIHSVDLVDRGATTGSLHESEGIPMDWRESLAQACAAIFSDTTLDKKAVEEKLMHLAQTLEGEDGGDDGDGDTEEGAAAAAKPQPSEAMESVRTAYANDPNVAVLLECAGQYIKAQEIAKVKEWAVGKGIPSERLTEGVLTSLASLDESLRESFVQPLSATVGVKSAESAPIAPKKVLPGDKPAKVNPKELVKQVWG